MTEDAHDRLDLAILRQLQADGRATCEAIGERIGLSASAVLRRIKTLEDNATIERYVALLRPEALVMHPGPMNRGVELAPEVADLPCSAIVDQVRNGVAVRMAVLFLLLGAGKGLVARDLAPESDEAPSPRQEAHA